MSSVEGGEGTMSSSRIVRRSRSRFGRLPVAAAVLASAAFRARLVTGDVAFLAAAFEAVFLAGPFRPNRCARFAAALFAADLLATDFLAFLAADLLGADFFGFFATRFFVAPFAAFARLFAAATLAAFGAFEPFDAVELALDFAITGSPSP